MKGKKVIEARECWECGVLYACKKSDESILRKVWQRAMKYKDEENITWTEALNKACEEEGVELRIVDSWFYCGC